MELQKETPQLFCQRKPGLREVQALDQNHTVKESQLKFLLLDQWTFYYPSFPMGKTLHGPGSSCLEVGRATGSRSQKWKPITGFWGLLEKLNRALSFRPSQVFLIDSVVLGILVQLCTGFAPLSGPGFSTMVPADALFIHPSSTSTALGMMHIRVNNKEIVSSLRVFLRRKSRQPNNLFL